MELAFEVTLNVWLAVDEEFVEELLEIYDALIDAEEFDEKFLAPQ